MEAVKVIDFPGRERMWVYPYIEFQSSGYGVVGNDAIMSELSEYDLVSYSIDESGTRRFQFYYIPITSSEMIVADTKTITEELNERIKNGEVRVVVE